MFTNTCQFSFAGSKTITKTLTATGGLRVSIDEQVPGESADLEVACELDVSQLQALCIQSDQDCTVKTNSDSVPDDTITLTANQPYIWFTGMGAPAGQDIKLGTDVTSLFVTVAGATAANFQLEALLDPTI